MDSLRVTLTLTQKTLSVILDKAFENTIYHYFITDDHEVILTKNLKVTADLAPGIFNNQPAATTSPATPATIVDYSEEKTAKVAEATTENKLYEIGLRTTNMNGTANLAGYVKNAKSGEGIIGASVYNPDTKIGIATDQFSLPSAYSTIFLRVSFIPRPLITSVCLPLGSVNE